MKTIYVRGPEPKRRTKLYLFLFFILFLIILRALTPLVIENIVNHSGSDSRGYTFRVEDVDLKLLRGEMSVAEFRVFNKATNQNLVEGKDITFNFDPTKIFDDKKMLTIKGKEIDVLISKALFDEVKRVKNEAKESVKGEMYLSKVEAEIDKLNVKQFDNNKPRTLITLEKVESELRDFGVGSINENTEFTMNSKITGGGSIHLEGKTILEKERTPWMIEGRMEQISSGVIEKLAGNKLPFEVEEANIDAGIMAHSNGEQITGVLKPKIKNFKVAENKDNNLIKRGLAKVSNYLFDKTKGKDKELDLDLPFTLNENFTLNLPETIDKVIK